MRGKDFVKMAIRPLVLGLMWKRKIANLNRYEYRVFSQNGEDGILQAIFSKIGRTNRYFVEFGVQDGNECNTRLLLKKGWSGLWMDADTTNNSRAKKEFITAENINHLFEKHSVPKQFDLLCIDIDGNDYWVWKAITQYQPRVVVIEYNSSVLPEQSLVMKYDPKHLWDETNYFGAGIKALAELGAAKGYTLVACDSRGINAFFVQSDLAKRHFAPKPPKELFRPPGFGVKENGNHIGHPRSQRMMIEV